MADRKELLIQKLDGLSKALRKSGKQGPLEFFKGLREKIAGAKNNDEVRMLVENEILKSGALVQYANFSPSEEAAYKELYKAAENWI